MRSRYSLAALLASGLALGTFAFPSAARALPLPGTSLFAQTTGEVFATFLGSSAAFTSDLYLDGHPDSREAIFTTQTTLPGTTVSLGHFRGGTELVFRLGVRDTGADFFTGAGAQNADGVVHAVINSDEGAAHAGADNHFSPDTTSVGFEDLVGGGDLDYDDLTVAFTNTSSTPPVQTPEPTAVLLLGTGVVALLGLKKLLPV